MQKENNSKKLPALFVWRRTCPALVTLGVTPCGGLDQTEGDVPLQTRVRMDKDPIAQCLVFHARCLYPFRGGPRRPCRVYFIFRNQDQGGRRRCRGRRNAVSASHSLRTKETASATTTTTTKKKKKKKRRKQARKQGIIMRMQGRVFSVLFWSVLLSVCFVLFRLRSCFTSIVVGAV